MVVATAAALALGGSAGSARAELRGKLLSGDAPLSRMPVTLYGVLPGVKPVVLGRALSARDGTFAIPHGALKGVVYLIAGRGEVVRVASVLGVGSAPRRVVVNERTTVAAGFALAQFMSGRRIAGKAPGLQNAARMAENLADARTGRVAAVLARPPNGRTTSTLRELNSLANMLALCVRLDRCAPLFRLARPPRGRAPLGTLAAVATIARNPWQNVRALFALSRSGPAPYQPALQRAQRPDAWTLAVRFVGDGTSVDGPGNIAIDARGNLWVTNNYVFGRNVLKSSCGGKQLLEFTPTGRAYPGSPWSGGGVNGAGFGITFDPEGHLWLGNFGFAGKGCTQAPPRNSVSEFSADGKPVSPSATSSSTGGYTQGAISYPQGTVSDRGGNIWIANCGNDTVTKYVSGDPGAAQVFGGVGIEPFYIAFNLKGQVFVTGNTSNSVAVLNPDGTPARGLITGSGLDEPLGIAADSRGNMWVGNSTLLSVPCKDTQIPTQSLGGSLTFINANRVPAVKAYSGGGLKVPWGLAVDGADNVWVANFAGERLSEFCGARPAGCPPGKTKGEPISPSTGFSFDGFVRNTGIAIDQSGNVWVCNNWKIIPVQTNPGGYQLVVFVGLARPIRTPLIGPPRSP